jgi:hypothetical protein
MRTPCQTFELRVAHQAQACRQPLDPRIGCLFEAVRRVSMVSPRHKQEGELSEVKDKRGQRNERELPDEHAGAGDQPRAHEIGHRLAT